MKIEDKRSNIVFENVDDGAIFDCNGCIFIKLDREVRDTIDMGDIYNAVDLKTGEPYLIGNERIVHLVNAEGIII